MDLIPWGLSLPALGRPNDGAFDGDVSHPPAASGTVDDLNRGVGRGHLSAIGTCLVYPVSAMVTAMVAVAVGGYAGALLNSSHKATSGALAAGIIVAMMAVSIWGERTVGRARGLIVVVVVGMLAVLEGRDLVVRREQVVLQAQPPLLAGHQIGRTAAQFIPRLRTDLLTGIAFLAMAAMVAVGAGG